LKDLSPATSASSPLLGEATRFGVIGVANTLLDFVLFQALTKIFGIPLSQVWIAKAISGSVALASSFALNRSWVFRAGGRIAGQATRFVVATVIGVFVIQTLLTQFFSSVVPGPGELAYRLVEALGLDAIMSEAFVIKTVAFGLATVASMTWNFAAYKWWVFGPRVAPGARVP
jgi:putative flippase GtrA